MSAEDRLRELNLALPPAPKPMGVYKPIVVCDRLAFVSGHGPLRADRTLITGRIGADLSLEDGYAAAHQTGLAILATVRQHFGSLDPVQRVIKTLGMESRTPVLKTYPLHEGSELSFGAICGGEVTVLIEPFPAADGLYLVGAGHCARAVAELARGCGWRVTVLDDRADLLSGFPADASVADRSPAEFIAQHPWKAEEALVIVSRNFHIDRDALRSALSRERIAYIGMIGSRKKVRHVFDELRAERIAEDKLALVYAPIGLDVGADSPAEIAVAVMFEPSRGCYPTSSPPRCSRHPSHQDFPRSTHCSPRSIRRCPT